MGKVIVDQAKCDPSACDNGICAAKRSCPTKAIFQIEPYEVPVTDWQRCRACTKCIAACPVKAVVVGE
ncbi:MAG: hypothetical protein M1358_07345 [Chloroflexi bacterium]|nr:hypothetical protein [Chloroflexota bacterium]